MHDDDKGDNHPTEWIEQKTAEFLAIQNEKNAHVLHRLAKKIARDKPSCESLYLNGLMDCSSRILTADHVVSVTALHRFINGIKIKIYILVMVIVSKFCKQVIISVLVKSMGNALVGAHCYCADGDKTIRPLLDFRDCEVEDTGKLCGCGFAFDNVHLSTGFAPCCPAFDVVGIRIHSLPPFQLKHNLGLPALDPGKLSSA